MELTLTLSIQVSIEKIELPTGVEILGFANDTLVVILAKTVDDLETQSNVPLARISKEIPNLGLQIAAEKKEAVLFTRKYKYATPKIAIYGMPIKLIDEMTYLGIIVDKSKLYKTHMKKAAEKAGKIEARLVKLMPNIAGRQDYRRRLPVVNLGSTLGSTIGARGQQLGQPRVQPRVQRQVQSFFFMRYRGARIRGELRSV